MTTEEEKALAKRVARIAMIVGMVLALVCQFVPPEYQTGCGLVAQLVPHACS
jgi:hypothetical protein